MPAGSPFLILKLLIPPVHGVYYFTLWCAKDGKWGHVTATEQMTSKQTKSSVVAHRYMTYAQLQEFYKDEEVVQAVMQSRRQLGLFQRHPEALHLERAIQYYCEIQREDMTRCDDILKRQLSLELDSVDGEHVGHIKDCVDKFKDRFHKKQPASICDGRPKVAEMPAVHPSSAGAASDAMVPQLHEHGMPAVPFAQSEEYVKLKREADELRAQKAERDKAEQAEKKDRELKKEDAKKKREEVRNQTDMKLRRAKTFLQSRTSQLEAEIVNTSRKGSCKLDPGLKSSYNTKFKKLLETTQKAVQAAESSLQVYDECAEEDSKPDLVQEFAEAQRMVVTISADLKAFNSMIRSYQRSSTPASTS